MNIHVWEFEYYCPQIQEQTHCQYYTLSDNNNLAIQTFLEDEGEDTEYYVSLDEIITDTDLMKTQGTLSLVLDL